MSLTSRIAYNTLVQAFGRGLALLLAVLSVGVLTRYLGQAGFGQYTTIITFVQLFGVLADLGLYVMTVKKISEVGADTNRLFSNIFTLRLFSVLFFVLLAPVVVLLMPYPPLIKVGVAIATFSNLFVSLNQIFLGLYQKSLAMHRAVISEVIGRMVFLGFLVLVTQRGGSLSTVLWVTVGAAFAQFVATFFLARRLVQVRLRIDRDIWVGLIRESWPIAVSIGLNLIYFRADTVILSLFYPAATVGLYGAGYKVLEVLITFPAMFAGLMTPLLARHWSGQNHERFGVALQRSFDVLTMLALPIVAGVFLLAHPIMVLVAGSDFEFSGSILRVLIFAAGTIFLGNLFGNTVVVLGQQRRMVKVYLVVAIVSLVGYFILIPSFSVWGASAVTVATELSITLASLAVVWRTTRIRLSTGQPMRSLVASLVMVGAILALHGQPLYVTIPVGLVVYVAALFFLRGLKISELQALFARQ